MEGAAPVSLPGPLPVIAVAGPTAVGKSALALLLAEELGGEIVNADALQVYRGLDVGTAKPSRDERRRVPHHLLDVVEPEEPFSAGELGRRGRAVIADVKARGRVPIVVGGSGLYLRALLDGLSPVPSSPEERRRLEQRLAVEGLPCLYEELAARDPETAARLAPGDTQRILRALEVVAASGRPLSAWLREPAAEPPIPALRLALTVPRAVLYDRIALRVRAMVGRGWVAEVASLLERGTSADAPAFQAIGYRQMVRHLRGELTLEEATADVVRATRRYAKRQLTWLRKEPEVRWVAALELPASFPSLVGHLRGELTSMVCAESWRSGRNGQA